MTWVTLLLGGLAGFIFGSLIAFVNYSMTKRLVGKADADSIKKAFAAVYFFRQIMNVAALMLVYFCRNVLPVPFYYPLIGTAVGLALPSQLLAIRNANKKKTTKS